MKKTRVAIIAMFGIAVAVLGYGYWHSNTHAWAYFSLEFETAGTAVKDKLPKARVKFKDTDGNILAEGVTDDELGIVYLLDPVTGGCHDIEKRAPYSAAANKKWRECFAIQSAWIPTWIDRVRHVQVKYDLCVTSDMPIEVSAGTDAWLLWWVPLPHVGGKPYSYYSAIVVVRESDCIK